jgi:hypothetical protein
MTVAKATRLGKIAGVCVLIAMFLNPFGFDAVQYWLINQTGSIYKANFVLYVASASLFGCGIFLRQLSKKYEKKSIDTNN